jgi:hypothetical protein
MRKPRICRQDGGTLVVVLLFISVFGLVISGLMTESSVNVKFTTSVNSQEAKVYAADAGVSYGIQQLRQDPAFCPRIGVSGPAIPDLNVNGKTVKVTCSVNSGSNGGADGYAVVVMSPNPNSLVLSNANPKNISGDVYVSGGVSWGPGLKVTDGNFILQDHGGVTGCINPPVIHNPPQAGDNLTVGPNPPFGYACKPTSVYPVPNPPHAPPPIPAVTNPSYASNGSCRIFKPGLYTSPPTLQNGDNYFASGVYYFNFNDPTPANNVIDVKQATIYGGQPASGELAQQRFPIPANCPQNQSQDATYGGSGTGVEFIFGSQASLFVDTQGQVELYGRQTANAASTETRNISLVAVPNNDPTVWPTTPGNWTASNLASGTNVLDIKDGNQQDLAVHGMVYAPTAGVGLTATNSVLAQTMGGLIAWTLQMKSSASAQGLAVSIAPGIPTPRVVYIVGTAQDGGGGRDVPSSAVVQIDNDDANTAHVQSWRTRGPSDPL